MKKFLVVLSVLLCTACISNAQQKINPHRFPYKATFISTDTVDVKEKLVVSIFLSEFHDTTYVFHNQPMSVPYVLNKTYTMSKANDRPITIAGKRAECKIFVTELSETAKP